MTSHHGTSRTRLIPHSASWKRNSVGVRKDTDTSQICYWIKLRHYIYLSLAHQRTSFWVTLSTLLPAAHWPTNTVCNHLGLCRIWGIHSFTCAVEIGKAADKVHHELAIKFTCYNVLIPPSFYSSFRKMPLTLIQLNGDRSRQSLNFYGGRFKQMQIHIMWRLFSAINYKAFFALVQ